MNFLDLSELMFRHFDFVMNATTFGSPIRILMISQNANATPASARIGLLFVCVTMKLFCIPKSGLTNARFQTASVAMAKNKPGSHKTIHPSLKSSIQDLINIPGVDRVILGPSKGARHNRPVGSLKIQTDTDSSIRMIGYSDRGISVFYVVTSIIQTVREEIERRFSIA